MTGFQKTMNAQPAIGIEGDWYGANPRFTLLAGEGRLVAGPEGVTVGRFAWANPNGIVHNGGGQGRLGFVHRDQPAFITDWLAQSTLKVNGGLDMTLHVAADVLCRFAGGAIPNQKVYANYADGTAYAAATGSAAQAAAITAAIAASTFSVTGQIDGDILTVSAVGSGTVVPGAVLSGTGVTSNTEVTEQIDGTAGGIGHYRVNFPQSVVSETITGAYGTMTVSAVASGSLAVGDVISGSGVTAGTQIRALGTGLGNTGTYIVNPSQAVSSESMTAVGSVETPWFVESYAAAGELAFISTRG